MCYLFGWKTSTLSIRVTQYSVVDGTNESILTLRDVDFDDTVHGLHSTLINERTFLQDFLLIPINSLQNYQKILTKCFFGTAYIVICLAWSKLQWHYSVLPVAKPVLQFIIMLNFKEISSDTYFLCTDSCKYVMNSGFRRCHHNKP